MAIVPENYLEDALSRLLQQFKEKDNITNLLKAYLDSLQITSQSLADFANQNNLQDAVGAMLDVLGKVVGESRKGRTDESYRLAIQNRIVVNNSEGTPNQLLEILQLLSPTSTDNKIFEHFPLSLNFYIKGGTITKSAVNTLFNASPITTERVGVYHDVDDDAWIPSELEAEGGILIDDQQREFVTDEGENIVVNYLAGLNAVNSDRAILPDIGELTDIRIPCEFYTSEV